MGERTPQLPAHALLVDVVPEAVRVVEDDLTPGSVTSRNHDSRF